MRIVTLTPEFGTVYTQIDGQRLAVVRPPPECPRRLPEKTLLRLLSDADGDG